jgi:thiamine-monophosphate kinase
MNEEEFIAGMRGIATHPFARGLSDDAAVVEFGGKQLVLTHDMIVEGVHFLAHDPPADVAWKLVAVNLSDLAAKGARPIAALLGYTLGSNEWNRAFVIGLEQALAAFDLPLIGGDTVSVPAGSLKALGLTAIGETKAAPSRAGAQPGDGIWVSGTIGDALVGLDISRGRAFGDASLRNRYRRPRPQLELGRMIAPLVTAMMDVSDGLLLDLSRLAAVSGRAAALDLDAVPLSDAFAAVRGRTREARVAAATGGDDYELLFTLPDGAGEQVQALAAEAGTAVTRIGTINEGEGLTLTDSEGDVPLPERLGYQHA